MKILVPIKRVPDPFAKVRPLSDGSGLDLSSVGFEINPFDEIALEAVVTLAEDGLDAEITVLSIGSDSEEQLRKALAMGADKAVLVESEGELDSNSVAEELAAQVSAGGYELVVMGKQATDDDSGQAGQMLAAKLNWPQACFASSISISNGSATVKRETDLGDQTVDVQLPAVITADLRLAEPRYIPLPGIIRARSKPLERTSRLSSSQPGVTVTKVEPAPARPPGRMVQSVDDLLSALKGMGALN